MSGQEGNSFSDEKHAAKLPNNIEDFIEKHCKLCSSGTKLTELRQETALKGFEFMRLLGRIFSPKGSNYQKKFNFVFIQKSLLMVLIDLPSHRSSEKPRRTPANEQRRENRPETSSIESHEKSHGLRFHRRLASSQGDEGGTRVVAFVTVDKS
jgi:hypothetical protein